MHALCCRSVGNQGPIKSYCLCCPWYKGHTAYGGMADFVPLSALTMTCIVKRKCTHSLGSSSKKGWWQKKKHRKVEGLFTWKHQPFFKTLKQLHMMCVCVRVRCVNTHTTSTTSHLPHYHTHHIHYQPSTTLPHTPHLLPAIHHTTTHTTFTTSHPPHYHTHHIHYQPSTTLPHTHYHHTRPSYIALVQSKLLFIKALYETNSVVCTNNNLHCQEEVYPFTWFK